MIDIFFFFKWNNVEITKEEKQMKIQKVGEILIDRKSGIRTLMRLASCVAVGYSHPHPSPRDTRHRGIIVIYMVKEREGGRWERETDREIDIQTDRQTRRKMSQMEHDYKKR